MRQLRALLAASFHLCCLLTVTAIAQNQTLQLGSPIEREIATGQTHTYTVTAEENTLIQLSVEQRGIDVVIRVSSPADKQLGEFDTPNGDNGPENISFIATEPGNYRIMVTPLGDPQREGAPSSGKYEIKLIELRPATEQELKAAKNLLAAKAKGLALLSDIDGLLAEIRSPQTRIRAQMEAAQLVWNSDEKRGSKYLADAMTGVKEFVASLDPADPNYYYHYSVMNQVRYEIVNFLAPRDPDAALNFVHSSKLPANPQGNEREEAEQERSLELTLANAVLAKDPKRAFQLARENLKKGFSQSLTNIVSMLRGNNPELATQLAGEIAAKLLNQALLKDSEAAALSINLMHGCRTSKKGMLGWPSLEPSNAEPLLSDDTCRDLFQKSIQEALSFKQPATTAYSPERNGAWSLLQGLQGFGTDLDTFVDGASARIEKKLAEINIVTNPYQAEMQTFQLKLDNGNTEAAIESVQKAPQEIRESLYVQLANHALAKGDSARARQIINDYVSNPQQKRQALANLEQQEMYAAVTRGKVEEALAAIANIRNPHERANMLMQVVTQIGPGQKRTNALALLEQVRGMLAPGIQAPDQEQMNVLLELARAFSRYDGKRAFEIVEPLVDQVNDICNAARTLEGFGVEFYEGDELNMQNGSGVANAAMQVSNALGVLAVQNFDRAKSMSDRLKLPEVRLRAYLAIAQQTIQGAPR